MNVLILNFSTEKKFSEHNRHTIDCVEMLQKRHHDFFLVSSSSPLLSVFQKRGWHGKHLRSSLFLFFFPALLLWYRFRWGVKTLFCQTEIDKIIATPFARLLRMHVIWSEETMRERTLAATMFLPLLRAIGRFATIITPSQRIKAALVRNGFSEETITVIPPGISNNATQWQETIFATIAEREHPTFYKEQFCVGTIAPLAKDSGLEYLLRSIATVKEVIPAIRCIIVGSGPDRQQLQWLAERLRIKENILFVGVQNVPARWVTHFDILIHPLIHEKSSRYILLETMIQQKPIIATRVGDHEEIIEQSKTGMLLESANAEMLAEAILNLYHHPDWREEMGKRGKLRVEKFFSLDRMTDAFEKVLLQ